MHAMVYIWRSEENLYNYFYWMCACLFMPCIRMEVRGQFIQLYLFLLTVCVFLHAMDTYGGQRTVSRPQSSFSTVWVLEIKLSSSDLVASSFPCWANSPALCSIRDDFLSTELLRFRFNGTKLLSLNHFLLSSLMAFQLIHYSVSAAAKNLFLWHPPFTVSLGKQDFPINGNRTIKYQLPKTSIQDHSKIIFLKVQWHNYLWLLT